jgi:hypothetical protein
MKPAEQAGAPYQLIGKDLLSRQVATRTPGDKLASKRSYIRHNGTAVAAAIADLRAQLTV